MSFTLRLGRGCVALIAVALISWLLSLGVSNAHATDTRIQGIGEMAYETGVFSSKPSAEDRQKAIELAKKNALERYASSFSSARFSLYQRVEPQILSDLDQYVMNAIVLDEGVNKDAKKYQVTVRATINEARLDAVLNSTAGVSSAGLQGATKISLSFLFVARKTASIRDYDSRRTQIENVKGATSATDSESLSGGSASSSESVERTSVVTTGGSTLRKASEAAYNVTSPEDLNATMSDVFTGHGFEVYDYRDVVGQCGGAEPDKIYAEFAHSDELSRKTRSVMFAAGRSCEVSAFAVGTLDVGLHDVDPVSGNPRVVVSVRSQVLNITGRLPRIIASVGPIQYAGQGIDKTEATGNALKLAASEVAKTISDQLKSKGLQ